MIDTQTQARLMTALKLITEALDGMEAHTRAAYACGYLDGLLAGGQMSVHSAQDLKSTAVKRRDKRLSELEAAPVQRAVQADC